MFFFPVLYFVSCHFCVTCCPVKHSARLRISSWPDAVDVGMAYNCSVFGSKQLTFLSSLIAGGWNQFASQVLQLALHLVPEKPASFSKLLNFIAWSQASLLCWLLKQLCHASFAFSLWKSVYNKPHLLSPDSTSLFYFFVHTILSFMLPKLSAFPKATPWFWVLTLQTFVSVLLNTFLDTESWVLAFYPLVRKTPSPIAVSPKHTLTPDVTFCPHPLSIIPHFHTFLLPPTMSFGTAGLSVWTV